ncbi:MAG: molybdopterin-dependent oxidoreductase [Raoultibacter sp.]
MEQYLTRRNLFEGAAALGALAALGGCTSKKLEEKPKNQIQEEPFDIGSMEVKHSWCYMCGPAKVLCSTLCYIKDGKWVHVEGNPVAGNNWGYGCKSLCAKGNSAMQALYNPSRIEYPMKRVGEKGEGKFERCSWDDALSAIGAKLLEDREKFGPESFALWSPQECKFVMQLGRRFLNVYGSPNYMHSAICQAQITSSREITIGTVADAYPKQLNKTKLLVNWGVNGENADMNNGPDGANPVRRFNAMEHGLQFIDIRPMLDPLASHAAIWVPVRPGTDGALALAILNVIIGEDLYDHEFCENWCNGFDKLAEHVKQFPPSWASPITGISENQIGEIARMMGTIKPMGIQYGNSAGDQSNDGSWTCVSINLIAAITGNLDIAGGGGAKMKKPDALFDCSKLNKVPSLADKLPVYKEDTSNGWAPSRSKIVAPEFPRWYQNPKTWGITPLFSEPTTAANRGIRSVLTEKPFPLKSVFAHSTNPLSSTRNPAQVAEALKKLDFYFVMDTEWNPSCDYADYVLPACTRYEDSCQIGSSNMEEGTFIGIEQKIAEPLGESRSDWRFYCDLAAKMGLEKDFWDGDFDQLLRTQLEPTGFTLEELREKGYIFVERSDGSKATEPQYQNYAKLFEKLPNGKVQCYNEIVGGMPNNRDDGVLGFLPVYVGPPEGIAETPKLAEEYPLIFSDVHAHRLSVHSYFSDLPYLRERNRLPWVKINPKTAKKYGIEDGAWMKIESPHGWVKMTAEYFEGISPEVLMGKRGWWQDCKELDEPGYGCFDGGSEVNVLYDSTIEKYDGFHSGMAKQTLVKISKWEG